MVDINYIRSNLESVQKGIFAKGFKLDLKRLLVIDDHRRELIVQVDELRHERNIIARARDTKKGKQLKIQLDQLEQELTRIEQEFADLMLQVPNPPLPDVAIGKNESENQVVKTWGKLPQFDFTAKDHLQLGEALDIIDIERAAKVTGARFNYLKGPAVQLEFALVCFAMDVLTKEGFIPVIPPVLIKQEAMQKMGYWEHGGEDEMYVLDKDGLVLVGTSEQSIGPMHQNEVLDEGRLPLRYVGFSSCFRREAGSYGKDTRGILRVHQFDKTEMFSFTKPELGDEEHKFFLQLEEQFFQALNIPYQVVKMCTGDLGTPAARKYDLEAWMPAQGRFREVTSTSTTTDFQARRLNIKYRDKDQTGFVHMINGTAFAIGRTIIAILENYQQEDGSVVAPEVLRKYTGFSVIKPK